MEDSNRDNQTRLIRETFMRETSEAINEAEAEEEERVTGTREQLVEDMIRGQAELDRPEEADGEIQEARSEGLLQQLQDTRRNQEAYTGVTLEDVREMVNDLEAGRPVHTVQDVRNGVVAGVDPVANTEPRLMRIDMSNVPTGMTAEEFVRQYQSTGMTYTSTGSTVTGTITTNSDSTTYVDSTNLDAEMLETTSRLIDEGTVTVDEENGARIVTGDEPDPPLANDTPSTIKQIRAKMRKADPKDYKRAAEVAIANKFVQNIHNLEKKRETYLSKLKIAPDEIAVDMKGHMFFNNFYDHIDSIRASKSFTFNKNFDLFHKFHGRRQGKPSQRLAVNAIRLNDIHLSNVNVDSTPVIKKYFFINRTAFLESRGQRIKVTKRNNVTISDILDISKKLRRASTLMEESIVYLRDAIGNVLPPDDFEIFYQLQSLTEDNPVTVLLKFRDVVVTNSIELSRELGTMILKLEGTHHMAPNKLAPYLVFQSFPSGMRMTFNSEDAVAGWRHSHLTQGIANGFNAFCTGNQDYTLDQPSALEIESHIHRLKEFVSWESLEGGPHFRIENINPIGTKHHPIKNSRGRSVATDSYIRGMIKVINETDGGFGSFSDCFRITNVNGALSFVVDRVTFYTRIIEMFDESALNNLRLHDRNKRYYYVPQANQFYRVRTNIEVEPRRLQEEAIKKIATIPPVYMNGKYTKPTIVEQSDPFAGKRFSPHPDVMNELINVILYHLTNKLEEHGKSS